MSSVIGGPGAAGNAAAFRRGAGIAAGGPPTAQQADDAPGTG